MIDLILFAYDYIIYIYIYICTCEQEFHAVGVPICFPFILAVQQPHKPDLSHCVIMSMFLTCWTDVVNGNIFFEVDTRAAVSIISDATHNAMLPALKIYKSNLHLKNYTEEQIALVGNIH